jgi:hypothetical protein
MVDSDQEEKDAEDWISDDEGEGKEQKSKYEYFAVSPFKDLYKLSPVV